MRSISLLFVLTTIAIFTSCVDREALAQASFGKIGDDKAKASPASVISMGRDDDDGKAKKWHIGGRN